MPTEVPFRIAVFVILAIAMTIGVYHRVQAAASGERISHQAEGYMFALVLRLVGLAAWFAIFAYLLFPTSVQWAAMPLPTWLRWLGVATGGCSAWLMYWTLTSLGKNLTDTVVTRTDATLVTHGPYRWVRHPFYITAALLLLSTTLLAANWLIGALGLSILILLAIRTPKEERMLIERFGDSYRQYMAQTGRFVPKLTRPSQ